MAAPVADKTGLRVEGKLHGLPVLATGWLTWIGLHAHRGQKACEALGFGLRRAPLPACPGRRPSLIYVFEEMGQAWANRWIEMWVAACPEVTAADA